MAGTEPGPGEEVRDSSGHESEWWGSRSPVNKQLKSKKTMLRVKKEDIAMNCGSMDINIKEKTIKPEEIFI